MIEDVQTISDTLDSIVVNKYFLFLVNVGMGLFITEQFKRFEIIKNKIKAHRVGIYNAILILWTFIATIMMQYTNASITGFWFYDLGLTFITASVVYQMGWKQLSEKLSKLNIINKFFHG